MDDVEQRLAWIAKLQADAALERADMEERAQRRLAGEEDPLERWRRLQPPLPKPAPVTPPTPTRTVAARKPMDTTKLIEALADASGENVREIVGDLRRDLAGRMERLEAENADLRERLRAIEGALIARAVQSGDQLSLPAPRGNSRDAH